MMSPNTICPKQITAARLSLLGVIAVTVVASVAACSRTPEAQASDATPPRVAGTVLTLRDTMIEATIEASGTAAPLRQATLSTKLMGTVTAVLVQEGDHVGPGQVLVRIDARDLAARSAQTAATIAEAEAVERDAQVQARRIRSLYADSAATRAQLDAAETGLSRASAGLAAARASAAELNAISSYAVVAAPFAGTITRRFVDPGAFAAPGAPLVAIQDASQLRVTASATPDVAQRVHRGQTIATTIEGRTVRATAEGIVPAVTGNLYAVNALVPNADGAMLAGSTATLAIPTGRRPALLVPADAIVRQGDLTGVELRLPAGDARRWVRLGPSAGDLVEVAAGLHAGDQIVVPSPRVASAALER